MQTKLFIKMFKILKITDMVTVQNF